MSCNDSHSDAGGVAPRPLIRAGVRRPPRGSDEPTGAFVVLEMAVLFCVSALAMVSIIVSVDDGSVAQVSRPDDRSSAVIAHHDVDKATKPSTTVQTVR